MVRISALGGDNNPFGLVPVTQLACLVFWPPEIFCNANENTR